MIISNWLCSAICLWKRDKRKPEDSGRSVLSASLGP